MSVPLSVLPTLPATPSGGGGAQVPQAVSLAPALGVSTALVAQPNFPFFLRHRADAWEVGFVEVDGKRAAVALPQLGRFVLRPGVGGVRTTDRHEAPQKAYEEAVQREALRGWVFLDPSKALAAAHRPKGAPETGYLVKYDCVQPGTGSPGVRYEEAWNVLQSVPLGLPAEWRFDADTFNRWRASLVTEKIIQPCSASVLAQLQRRYQGRLERVEVLNIPEDVRKRRVSTAKALADAATKAVPALEATP